MICLLTIVFASKELLLTYSVIQKLFFFSQQSQAMFIYSCICIPTQIGELLLTYSVTQSGFSHDMLSHVYYAHLSIQICIFSLIKEWSSLTFLVTQAFSRWYYLQLYLHPVPIEGLLLAYLIIQNAYFTMIELRLRQFNTSNKNFLWCI